MTVARFSHCASRCSLFSLVSTSLILPLASGGSRGAGVFCGASPRSLGRCELLSLLLKPLLRPKCSLSLNLLSFFGRTGSVEEAEVSSGCEGSVEDELTVEERVALLLRKILRRFFWSGEGTWPCADWSSSSPGNEGGTMTSCSCVVVRTKVNSGMGLGSEANEFELVLRVLPASPWMLDRFLRTSFNGMVSVSVVRVSWLWSSSQRVFRKRRNSCGVGPGEEGGLCIQAISTSRGALLALDLMADETALAASVLIGQASSFVP